MSDRSPTESRNRARTPDSIIAAAILGIAIVIASLILADGMASLGKCN